MYLGHSNKKGERMQSINHHNSLKVISSEYTYKIGMNEVQGLEASLNKCLEPLKKLLEEKIYWSKVEFERAEYLRRDGFIPHSHNCGGLQFNVTIPKCESYGFGSIEFGEVTDDDLKDCKNDQEREEVEQSYEDEGHLDAHLSIWFKFEGFNESGEMKFYLVASAGNDDAPYFRNIPTIFETDFTVKTLKQLEFRGLQAVKKLIKEVF